MLNDVIMDSDIENSENVENSIDDAKIRDIIQNIDNLIEKYKNDHNIEDMRSISQQEFTGVLKYVRFNYITPTKCLFEYYPGSSNDKQVTLKYNDYIVGCICDYYMYLCNIYNKVVNVYGFYALSGIDFGTIDRWADMKVQRPEAYRTTKKLHIEYEKSLENGAQSGKNPVGFIATLNHRFGWSSEGKTTLTVNITRNKDEIMSSVNPELIGKNE